MPSISASRAAATSARRRSRASSSCGARRPTTRRCGSSSSPSIRRNDGPKEVGQYAALFNAPIIGLTGSAAQIDQVKKQYGIFAEPVPHAAMGKQMEHTATVLLFDRAGQFAGTISPDDPDAEAVAKLKALVA